MAEPKTKLTNKDPREFLDTLMPEQKRLDGLALLEMFQRITGEKAGMWGSSIVGFGSYDSKSGVWPLIAFSPRKTHFTLYITEFDKENNLNLNTLGKYKMMGACLHIKKLSDVNRAVLAEIIYKSYQRSKMVHANYDN